MKVIGSVKEDLAVEKRISITPETIKKFIDLKFSVLLEKNYAAHLGITDEEYKNKGANLYSSAKELLEKSDWCKNKPLHQILVEPQETECTPNDCWCSYHDNPYDNYFYSYILNPPNRNVQKQVIFSTRLCPRMCEEKLQGVLSR